MRKYQPIWNKLKQTGKCELVAHPVLFKRIIKAVRKEKDKDITFSFELAEKDSVAKLTTTQDTNAKTIIFKLSINKIGDYGL